MWSPEGVGSSMEAGAPEEVGLAAVDGPVEGAGLVAGVGSPNGVGSLRLSGSWTLQVLQCEPEIESKLTKIISASVRTCVHSYHHKH